MTMELKTKAVLHDASPSWNGFNYQGKVGLLVCLTLIKERLEGLVSPNLFDTTTFSDFALEYEWLEDFSIIENNEYRSIHQVKHYDNENFSGYLDAIDTIISRKNGIISASEISSYLKVQKSESALEDANKIYSHLKSIGAIGEDGALNSNWISLADKFIIDHRDSIRQYLNDFQTLYLQAYGKNIPVYLHSSRKISPPTKDISTYSWKHTSTATTLNSNTLPGLNIHIAGGYGIPFPLALSDVDLSVRLRSLIISIRKIIKPEAIPIENTSVECYLAALLLRIDQHISARHNFITAKNASDYGKILDRRISFTEFVDIIFKDFYDHDDEHFSLCAKLIFEESILSRINMLNLAMLDIAPTEDQFKTLLNAKSRLEQYRNNVLIKAEGKNLLRYLEQASPHLKKMEPRLTYFLKISQSSPITNILLGFIELLERNIEDFFATCEFRERYLPSCIDLSDHPSPVANQRLAKEIADAADASAFINMLLYDYHYITIKAKENSDSTFPVEPPRFSDLQNEDFPVFHERKKTHLVHYRAAATKINKKT